MENLQHDISSVSEKAEAEKAAIDEELQRLGEMVATFHRAFAKVGTCVWCRNTLEAWRALRSIHAPHRAVPVRACRLQQVAPM